MQIIDIAQDGVVRLELNGHHFSVQVGQLAHPALRGGGEDRGWLITPTMRCTDTGCATTADTGFPVNGTEPAQRIHAHWRASKDTGQRSRRDKLRAAMIAVNDEARARGGFAFLDPDRQSLEDTTAPQTVVVPPPSPNPAPLPEPSRRP